jgi:hypothetical protein
MTHHQLLADRHGVEPTDCVGELARLGVYKDHHLARDGLVERTVTVWECAACSARVATSEGFVLNAYRPWVCALHEKVEATMPGDAAG